MRCAIFSQGEKTERKPDAELGRCRRDRRVCGGLEAVVEIESGMTAQPDTIYVTPRNTNVILRNHELQLIERSGHPASPKPPGDRLLKSIAAECG